MVGADGKISAGNRVSRPCTSLGTYSCTGHKGAFIFNTCDEVARISEGEMRDVNEKDKLVYLENLSCKLLDNPLKDRECLYNTVSYGDAGAELTYNFVTGIWGRDDGRKFKTGERVE